MIGRIALLAATAMCASADNSYSLEGVQIISVNGVAYSATNIAYLFHRIGDEVSNIMRTVDQAGSMSTQYSYCNMTYSEILVDENGACQMYLDNSYCMGATAGLDLTSNTTTPCQAVIGNGHWFNHTIAGATTIVYNWCIGGTVEHPLLLYYAVASLEKGVLVETVVNQGSFNNTASPDLFGYVCSGEFVEDEEDGDAEAVSVSQSAGAATKAATAAAEGRARDAVASDAKADTKAKGKKGKGKGKHAKPGKPHAVDTKDDKQHGFNSHPVNATAGMPSKGLFGRRGKRADKKAAAGPVVGEDVNLRAEEVAAAAESGKRHRRGHKRVHMPVKSTDAVEGASARSAAIARIMKAHGLTE